MEDTTVSGTLIFTDVIDGASAPMFAVTSSAAHGTATIDPATGSWSYQPSADFNGNDSFMVAVKDNDGNSETHIVSICILAQNDARRLW